MTELQFHEGRSRRRRRPGHFGGLPVGPGRRKRHGAGTCARGSGCVRRHVRVDELASQTPAPPTTTSTLPAWPCISGSARSSTIRRGSGSPETRRWAKSDEARREQKDRIQRLHSWRYRAEWIGLDDLMELEPDLSRDAVGDARIAFYPDDGLVDPVRFAATMMGAATRRHGAELRLGVHVTGADIKSGRIVAVSTPEGERYEADVFVNCAGRWVNDVVENAPDLSIPMAPTVGLLAFTPPAPTTIRRPLHSPGVNIRPDGAGRLMMASAATDSAIQSRGAGRRFIGSLRCSSCRKRLGSCPHSVG